MVNRRLIYGGLAAAFAVLAAIALALHSGRQSGARQGVLTPAEQRELTEARRKIDTAPPPGQTKSRTDSGKQTLDELERKMLLERIEALEARQMRGGWVSQVVSSASDIVGMLSALLSLLFTWMAYRLAVRSMPPVKDVGDAQV